MTDDSEYVDGQEVKRAFENAAEGEKVSVFDGLKLAREAFELKEQGNACVKKKQTNEAVKLYEQGLAALAKGDGYPMLREEKDQIDALRVVFHGNIAQCMLTLKLYRRAIDAASECLKLDKENAKALFRRSQAHEAVGEIEEALRDSVTLKRLGGGGLKQEDLEKRCESLYERHIGTNQKVNKVAKENEELFKMKERFETVMDKYDFDDGRIAPQVAMWLVTDNDFQCTVVKVAKRWEMAKTDAEDFTKWIKKGLDLKIIPNPLEAMKKLAESKAQNPREAMEALAASDTQDKTKAAS